MFGEWSSVDAAGVESSEMKLLLLGAMCYIGRSWTFNDIEESIAISREASRVFFLIFIKYESTILYKRWDLDPSLNVNVASHERYLM